MEYNLCWVNGMEHSFPPLVGDECRVLILGSLPGIKSLEAQQYYAHPQNRFWRLMFGILGAEFSDDYEKRKALLLEHHIALWDVVKCADREGSLDGNIRNQTPNEIPRLLEEHPKIRLILFNGAFAFNNYKKYFGIPALPYKKLLSTSPACAGRDQARLQMWKDALAEIIGR